MEKFDLSMKDGESFEEYSDRLDKWSMHPDEREMVERMEEREDAIRSLGDEVEYTEHESAPGIKDITVMEDGDAIGGRIDAWIFAASIGEILFDTRSCLAEFTGVTETGGRTVYSFRVISKSTFDEIIDMSRWSDLDTLTNQKGSQVLSKKVRDDQNL